MARLLDNGMIRHPKLHVIRDGVKTLRAAEDMDIDPSQAEYESYIAFLPPAEQEKARAIYRDAQRALVHAAAAAK